MNCKRAQLEIALWVGNDLDASAVEGVQLHLSECSPCRRHWEKLKASLNRLKEPVVAGAAAGHSRNSLRVSDQAMHDSVWPDLLTRLPSRIDGPQPMEFNGWLPALAVIAASLAIAAFWQNAPIGQSSPPIADAPRAAVPPPDDSDVVRRDRVPFGIAAFRTRRFAGRDDHVRHDSASGLNILLPEFLRLHGDPVMQSDEGGFPDPGFLDGVREDDCLTPSANSEE